MDELAYSSEALNVLDEFYEVSVMVYVEGVDDEIFWNKIIGTFYNEKFQVESLGGKEEVKKAFEALQEDDSLSYFVASDCDYSYFNNEIIENDKILLTYGYSIENTLIQKDSIMQLLLNVGTNDKQKAENEFGVLENSINKLVNNSLAKDIYCYSQGIKSIIGNNIDKFIPDKSITKQYDISEEIIGKCTQSICINNDYELEVNSKLQVSRFKAIDIINGHFLVSMLLKFISYNSKNFRKTMKLSTDGLLFALFNAFDTQFNSNHRHYSYYQTQVTKMTGS